MRNLLRAIRELFRFEYFWEVRVIRALRWVASPLGFRLAAEYAVNTVTDRRVERDLRAAGLGHLLETGVPTTPRGWERMEAEDIYYRLLVPMYSEGPMVYEKRKP